MSEVQRDARGPVSQALVQPANLPLFTFVLGSVVADAQLVAHTIPDELSARCAARLLWTLTLVGHEDRASAGQTRPLLGLPPNRHLKGSFLLTDQVSGRESVACDLERTTRPSGIPERLTLQSAGHLQGVRDQLPRLDVVPGALQEAERQFAHDLDRNLSRLTVALDRQLASASLATSSERDLGSAKGVEPSQCLTRVPAVGLVRFGVLDRDVDALPRLEDDPRTAQLELALERHICDLAIRIRRATDLLEFLHQGVADGLVVRDRTITILASLALHQWHNLVVEPLEEGEDDIFVVEERGNPSTTV